MCDGKPPPDSYREGGLGAKMAKQQNFSKTVLCELLIHSLEIISGFQPDCPVKITDAENLISNSIKILQCFYQHLKKDFAKYFSLQKIPKIIV